MANLEGMPISALPELTGDLQDEDEIVVYRPSTGKAYQANTDLIDSLDGFGSIDFTDMGVDVRQYIQDNLTGSKSVNLLNFYCGNVSTDITGLPSNYMLGIIFGTGNLRCIWCQRYNSNTIYVSSYNTNSKTWTNWSEK